MSRGIAVSTVALLLGLVTVPARAQTTVQGDVLIHSGPVTGRVGVNEPPRESEREVIVIERARVPRGHAYGWWKRHGYRAVTVYYDGTRYYSRRVVRPGLREVVIYERKGQYFLNDEDGERHEHKHHDHDDD
jgi:hypothetical protein